MYFLNRNWLMFGIVLVNCRVNNLSRRLVVLAFHKPAFVQIPLLCGLKIKCKENIFLKALGNARDPFSPFFDGMI